MSAALSQLPEVGTQLGRFRIDGVLGSGGSGVAYRAFDEVLETAVCLKIIHPAVSDHPETLARFKRELLLARRVTHPGICRLFDLHEERELRFLSMELVEGEVLRELFRGGATLDVETTLLLGERLARALAAAHAVGVVHRDLKPQNIIVRAGADPCILDFGIATALDLTHVTRPGVPLGTRHYIPPEVWNGEKATYASDVYALGVILFNCLTSRMPFTNKDSDQLVEMILRRERHRPSAFRSDVPASVDEIVLSCIALHPKDRPTSADALADALAALRAGLPPPSEDATVSQPPPLLAKSPPDDVAAGETRDRSWLARDEAALPNDDVTSVLRMFDADSALGLTETSPARRGGVGLLAGAVVAVSLVAGGLTAFSFSQPGDTPPDAVVTSNAAAAMEAEGTEAEGTEAEGTEAETHRGDASEAAASGASSLERASVRRPTQPAPLDALEPAVRRPRPPRPSSTMPATSKASTTQRSRARAAQASRAAASAARERWDDARQALQRAEARRGVLRGDLPTLDALHRAMKRHSSAGDYAAATAASQDALRVVDALRIDDAFVRAKLARFNARFDAAPDGAAKERAGGLMGEVLSDLGASRHERANATLNQALRALR